MINLPIKLEVSVFTHYEDMKGNAKYRNWGGLGRLRVIQGHRQHNQLIERIQFLIPL